MNKYFINKKGLGRRIGYAKRILNGSNDFQLFSGGLDSACVTPVLKNLGAEKVLYVFADRGQENYEEERIASSKILEIYSKTYKDSMLGLRKISVSIPAAESMDLFINADISVNTKYNMRNQIIGILACNTAGIYAEKHDLEFNILAAGSNASDVFSDNKPEAWKHLSNVFKANNANITCYAPFTMLGLDKKEELAFTLDISPEKDLPSIIEAINTSYSCWNPKGPCLNYECKPCKERSEAIIFTKELLGEKAEGLENPILLSHS